MVNTLEAVSWAAAQGVNAMEVDVVFDHTQQHEVRKVFHGGTCDCNAIPLLGFHESLDPDNNICGFGDDSVCRVLEKESATPHSLGDITCDASSKVPALFQAVAGLDSTSAISLFYIDSKLETMEPSELRAAALSISANLKEHLFGRGYTGNVIIGCPMVYHLEFIKAAVGEFEGTAYEGRVAVTIDGFIDYVTSANLVNLPDGPKQYTTPMVLKKLLAFPHRALSFGKTACAPAQRRHFEASQLAAMNYRAGVLSVPGVVWTIDDKETMRNFVKYHGARGIMTNVPSNALQVANESGFRLLKLVNQNFTKATSNAVVDKLSASCDC
jgi:glycerophosphoryl diester phosphodiesterase